MSIFSVIVTVCRGPGAQGIYSTHGTKKIDVRLCSVYLYLEGSIILKWVIWHVTFFFACRAQDYTFCLLIVRYTLSDKIKGKSALEARTFLHERDKVHVCYWFSIDGRQCRLKYF